MANLLCRIGRFSARRPWTVILGWLAALAVAGTALLMTGGTLASSFSIPGTETERVNEQLAEELSGLDGVTGTVVFRTADDTALDTGQRAQISDLLADVADTDGVDHVVDPFETAAQRAAQEQQIADGSAQLAEARAQLEAGRQQLDAAAAQAKAAGVYEQTAGQFEAQQADLDANASELDQQLEQLELSERLLDYASELRTLSADENTALGAVVFEDDLFSLPTEVKDAVAEQLEAAEIDGVLIDYSAEIASSIEGLLGVGEIIGVLIAALVLVVMLRALLPAILPLLTSILGVGVGIAGSLAFADVVEMSSVTPVLGVMLGLAVGIDYSLFILNRHRRQLLSGAELYESIGLANGTSGNAVVFAGSTVLVALLALNVTGIPFLGVMGTVGSACVLIAVLVAVTLTPALLGMLGMRVLGKRSRARVRVPRHAKPPARTMPTTRAVVTSVIAVIGLLVIAIPALSTRLGLPDGSSEEQDSTQYQAYTAIAEEFGAGQNGPLLVVADLAESVPESEVLATQADLAGRFMAQDHVVAVAPVGVSDDRDFFAFQVVPAEGPTSVSTEELVHELRGLAPLEGGIELGVAGQASGNIDISAKLASVMPIYLAVVIGLSLLIMIVVFRSLLVPVIATAGFVLSLFAALGAVTGVYQEGWLGQVFNVHDPGPVLNFAPIIIIGVLFGLAMDYQLFLVSGMREAYVHGLPAREAVVTGRRNGHAVVTAAAIIMASVFGGFIFSHLAMVRPLGFGLAIGVLFDAFAVRMLLIPALMHLVGEAAWWLPRWLDRLLPNVDVEGAALERNHAAAGVEDRDARTSERAGSVL